MDSSSSGRRPHRSDSAPSAGEQTNWATAQAATKTPLTQPASAPPAMCATSAGRTVMETPSPAMSSATDR